MEFRLLGPVEAVVRSSVIHLGPPRHRFVLAVLALEANQVVPLDRLVELSWPDSPPRSAVHAIQVAVSRIRSVLAAADAARYQVSLLTRGPGYLLDVDPAAVDAHRFRALVRQARDARDDERRVALLADGLALWRGPALSGTSPAVVCAQLSRGLEEARLAAIEDQADARLRLGRHADVVDELAGLVRAHPSRERPVGLLMLALYRSGLPAAALEVFRRAREHLAGEFGVDPGPGLRRLQAAILHNDPELALAGGEPRELAEPAAPPGRAQAGPPLKPGAAAAVTRTLPRDVAGFTGREAELDRIAAAVTEACEAGRVVAIHAIGGMPGIGKTALAVHAAHQLRSRFPDRQLFIDLHAHTPGQEPVAPAAALARLLADAGVDPHSLPPDLDGRAALWRDKMAGRKAVLVLDNAASSAQVTPLLPGEDCLVLVTSRRHLGDLPGRVVPVLLETLPPGQAREMFLRLTPAAAGAPEAAVGELAELAGFLPLAVSLLARVHARHSSWTLADLAAETRASLLTLAAENHSVAAAFEVSYRHLDTGEQQVFRALSVHPGTTVDAYAAAALAGIPLDEAGARLDALHREGLLTETGYRRYGMHDLIRRYARDLAAASLAAGGDRALSRLLDYYQHTAAIAEALLARQTQAAPAGTALAAPPAAAPSLPDRARALAWARAERANLLACLDHVTRAGQHDRVIALTAATSALLLHDGPWADAVSRQGTAAEVARRAGDRPGQAGALNQLAVAQRSTGEYPEAARAAAQALAIYRELGDRLGQANALSNLASVQIGTDDYPGATRALEEALGIYRELGDRLGQAGALTNLAAVRRPAADYPGATAALEEALGIYWDLGDLPGQAGALSKLGAVRRLTNDYPAAARYLEAALEIYCAAGNRMGQAGVLHSLGAMRQETGDYPGATRALEEALGIQRDIGNRLGQANALNELAVVRRLTGKYAAATQDAAEGLAIYRDLGDRLGQANALTLTGALGRLTGDHAGSARDLAAALGICRDCGYRLGRAIVLSEQGALRRATGDYPGAGQALEEALGIYRDIGNRGGEAAALNEAGMLHQARGDLDQARACHQRALDLAREIASAWDEAHALAGLGRCAPAPGSTGSTASPGTAALRQAREIFLRIGVPEAAAVAAELDARASRDPRRSVDGPAAEAPHADGQQASDSQDQHG